MWPVEIIFQPTAQPSLTSGECRIRMTTSLENLKKSGNKCIQHYAQLLVFATFGYRDL